MLPLPHYSFRKELGYQDYLSKTALNHREIKFDNQIGSYCCQDPYFCKLYHIIPDLAEHIGNVIPHLLLTQDQPRIDNSFYRFFYLMICRTISGLLTNSSIHSNRWEAEYAHHNCLSPFRNATGTLGTHSLRSPAVFPRSVHHNPRGMTNCHSPIPRIPDEWKLSGNWHPYPHLIWRCSSGHDMF